MELPAPPPAAARPGGAPESPTRPGPKARYIMIGGFLGAGKSTAVLQLARHLTERGLRVGLITNDQSVGLVDTTLAQSHGFDVSEITGGCFCCKFNSVIAASEHLSRHTRPDAFIAEPVGSCTDLVATVSYPLRRIYGEDFTVAPLSVLVDPVRALRVLGVEPGGSFSAKVVYIYRKQLEEASLIVINKCDLLAPDRLENLRQALQREFPGATVFAVSARHGTGLGPWFERLMANQQPGGPSMDVDYEEYAEGEALLGWLNCTVRLEGAVPFDGDALLLSIARRVQATLNGGGDSVMVGDRSGGEIAHLKMTLSPDDAGEDLAVVNLVRNDYVPELAQSLMGRIESGELIVNVRAEADPGRLKAAVEEAITASAAEQPGLSAEAGHLEHFRPAKPNPTHRMARE